MRRAAVSVPSNITEGSSRQGIKDSLQFYVIARPSLSELDTQLEICKELGLLSCDNLRPVSKSMEAVDALLSGLISYHRTKK